MKGSRLCDLTFWRSLDDFALDAWIWFVDTGLLMAEYDELLKHEAANVERVAHVQADIRFTRRGLEMARTERRRRLS